MNFKTTNKPSRSGGPPWETFTVLKPIKATSPGVLFSNRLLAALTSGRACVCFEPKPLTIGEIYLNLGSNLELLYRGFYVKTFNHSN